MIVELQGPQIRTGRQKEGATISYATGQSLKIVCDADAESDAMTITVSDPLPVSEDQLIYIADGDLVCKVMKIEGDVIEVKCLNSWDLEEHSQVHLPGIALDLFQPTEKDE